MKKQTWASFFSLGRSAMHRVHRSRAMMLYFQIKLLSASMDLLTRSVPPEKQDWKIILGFARYEMGETLKNMDKIERLKKWSEWTN